MVNPTWNNYAPNITITASAGTITTLVASSSHYQRITGTATQTVKLPDETTIPAGMSDVIDNDSSLSITIQDSAGNVLATGLPGAAGLFYSMSNATAVGNWAGYGYLPNTVTFGTAGLSAVGTAQYINNFNIGTTTPGSGSFTNVITTNLQASANAAPTIASASTIAPTTMITFVSGTNSIATITPPSPISTAGGTITIIPTGNFTLNTSGNIAMVVNVSIGQAFTLTYDSVGGKWYPSAADANTRWMSLIGF